MGDTIYRKQAIDTMQMFIDSMDKDSPAYKSMSIAFDRCIVELKKLPSAQPERKKGRWIAHEGGKFVGFPYMHYECDHCRAFEPTETNFCPNCGTDMREVIK